MSAENNTGDWLEPNLKDNKSEGQWPPVPNESASADNNGELTNCPHCHRKLLSTRSILCNWCGQKIDDPSYLDKAAHERAAQDERERQDIEQELTMTARLGVRGYIKQQGKNPIRPTLPLLFPDDKLK